MRKLILIALAVLATTLVAAPALAAGTTVKLRDSTFGAKKLTIRKGSKVTWNWAGVLRHNVFVKSGPTTFHSRTFVHGSFSHVFTRRGKYVLFCTLHPVSMRETVTVK
jgi:plastocyanin